MLPTDLKQGWPFTVPSGVVSCGRNQEAVFLEVDDRAYGLNGNAADGVHYAGRKSFEGSADLIRKTNPSLKRYGRIMLSTDEAIRFARKACGFDISAAQKGAAQAQARKSHDDPA